MPSESSLTIASSGAPHRAEPKIDSERTVIWSEKRPLFLSGPEEGLRAHRQWAQRSALLFNDWLLALRHLAETRVAVSEEEESDALTPGRPEGQPLAEQDSAVRTLLLRLDMAFDAEPLEACVWHPAEDLLAAALEPDSSPAVLRAIRDRCLDADRPVFASELLRCLARLPAPGSESWRCGLVRDALSSGTLEVRDAALEAADAWADAAVLRVLRSHRDSDPEFQGHIESVIRDRES